MQTSGVPAIDVERWSDAPSPDLTSVCNVESVHPIENPPPLLLFHLPFVFG